jgi:hypothetical protein
MQQKLRLGADGCVITSKFVKPKTKRAASTSNNARYLAIQQVMNDEWGISLPINSFAQKPILYSNIIPNRKFIFLSGATLDPTDDIMKCFQAINRSTSDFDALDNDDLIYFHHKTENYKLTLFVGELRQIIENSPNFIRDFNFKNVDFKLDTKGKDRILFKMHRDKDRVFLDISGNLIAVDSLALRNIDSNHDVHFNEYINPLMDDMIETGRRNLAS